MYRTLTRLIQAALLTATTLAAGAINASAPAAWSAHDREVAEACTKASGLKNAVASGKLIVFDDSIAQTALLVSGRYPQPHMNNQAGRVLCLFDRQTREATVAPADRLRWAAPEKPVKK